MGLGGYDAVLLDMDGVIRHWRPAAAEKVELAFGLPQGAIHRASRSVREDALGVRGECTFEDWLGAVTRELTPALGARARDAVAAWAAYRGEVDREMLRIVARLRAHVPVHVLSNAHDCFMNDMRLLGLENEFDGFHWSAELGLAKPDPAVYVTVLQRIGVNAAGCLFADDRPENVAGALAVGMPAFAFTTPHEFVSAIGTRFD